MTLRRARISDAAALADLATQLGYPTRPEEAETRLRDLVDRTDGIVLVAEEDGTVIGWGHVVEARRVELGPFAELVALVVDERRRGLGTGAALVQAALDWAAGQGFDTLRVRSNVVRERTHAFYERLGFERTKSQVMFVRSTGRYNDKMPA
ncbi:MAG TPA: GNAT family N-acetyltransferase [Thermoanaerobaculia bacterium]|jgi:GNAT superfamily N-acetyltransferase|nr:GNAT family N-acetyltransferase [Thermoanaerobaculia bacterium]